MNKSQISNLIFAAIIIILLFTPIGKFVKVQLHKIISFSPSIENIEDRVSLSDYNWSLQDLQANKLDFENTREKVVLVNFWATWCPPCVAEMPSIQKLYDDYKDKVVFVLVSNEKPDLIQNFLNKNKYSFPIYQELSQAPSEFATTSIPATFVLDKQGAIVIDKRGAADWNATKVRELLDSLIDD